MTLDATPVRVRQTGHGLGYGRCMRLALVTVAAAALLGASCAQAAPTPSKAARVTRDCLRAHGWSAVLADHGHTVNGQAPRVLPGLLRSRPWFSVSFYSWSVTENGRTVQHTGATQLRLHLNRSEARTAALCRARGLR